MKLGFNGGATIRWNTEPNLGIQAELNFTQHGWEEKFEEKPQYKYSRTVNYMELPFLTHTVSYTHLTLPTNREV